MTEKSDRKELERRLEQALASGEDRGVIARRM
jgi:hypothetical protein